MDQKLVEQRWGDWMLLGGLTLVTFVLHAAFYKGYGFFRDELYFIACSRHLAWGYVDQPPGAAVVAWASRHVLGDTLFAIRFVPMLFAAAQVVFAGLTARAMGGGRYALLLACISVVAAPQYFGSYLNTDMFMMLGWAPQSPEFTTQWPRKSAPNVESSHGTTVKQARLITSGANTVCPTPSGATTVTGCGGRGLTPENA